MSVALRELGEQWPPRVFMPRYMLTDTGWIERQSSTEIEYISKPEVDALLKEERAKFKLWGSNDCDSCVGGRIELYYVHGDCVECRNKLAEMRLAVKKAAWMSEIRGEGEDVK